MELREGLRAYAVDHALLYHSLVSKFNTQWEPLQRHEKGQELPPIVIAKVEVLALAEKKAVEKNAAEEYQEAEKLDDAPLDSGDDIDGSDSKEEVCYSDMEPADDG